MRRIAYCPMCRKERRMNERVEYSQLDCYKRATDEQKRKLNQWKERWNYCNNRFEN